MASNVKSILFICIFLSFFSFASANFVCGEVISKTEFSPAWSRLLVYYDAYPSHPIECTVTGEGKYCCDLDLIEVIDWSANLPVTVELFDSELDFIVDSGSVTTSDSAYDLVDTLILERPFSFEDYETVIPSSGGSSSSKDFSLDFASPDTVTEFKAIVSHESGTKEHILCSKDECSAQGLHFSLDFFSGQNDVSFIATLSDGSTLTLSDSLFSVDTLTVTREFICDSCKESRKGFTVPAGEEIEVVLKIESSHPIQAEFLEFIPESFEVISEDSTIDYSNSHGAIIYNIDGTNFEARYKIRSPKNILQKKYEFASSLDSSTSDTIFVPRVFWLYLPIYFTEQFNENTLYEQNLKQKISNERPYILNEIDDEMINLIALFSKKGGVYQASFSAKNTGFFSPKREYSIHSNIASNDLSQIYVELQIEKSKIKGQKMPSIYQKNEEITVDFYTEDDAYLYGRFYSPSKETFYINFS